MAVQFTGIGSEIPKRRITNQDWEKLVDTSDAWIQKNLGIQTRSRIEAERSTTDLGVAAAKKALHNAGCAWRQIDFILCATNSQEDLFPSTASKIQAALGNTQATSMDLQAGCTGWLYGMQLACSLVQSQQAENVLVVGTEALTRSLNFYDRSASLFGDGAGAALLSHARAGSNQILEEPLFASHTTPSSAMRQPTIYSESANALENYLTKKDLSMVERPLPVMDGKASLKLALNETLSDIKAVLAKAEKMGIDPDQIDMFVPHQTNIHIIKKFCKSVGFPFEKIPYTLAKYGGISTAGIATGMFEHWQSDKIKPGDLVLAAGYGAGFTSAAMLIEWGVGTKVIM